MSEETAEPRAQRKGRTRPAPERRAKGFLRAAELTPSALKSCGARRGFAELRLLTEWRAVVGEALASICRPMKVTYRSRGGLGASLILTTEGARAPEVEMQKTRIIDRVNAFYGYRAVSRIVIDQSRAPMMRAAPAGLAEAPAKWEGAPPAPVKDVADPGLALALARLGANVKAKTARAASDGPATGGNSSGSNE
ncbi:DUF721 domain-containing protein [Pikeienuella piscinae]|uniref:DUF721 domain-containing protein n=1 Tax=Pikeienuella piscinae TaxID=2748098 RepID=A0A7L5BZK9_9RHOB|nr:DUF721 domain-containing protein [Pikeienuella piscinae]QIE56268.1 DUF721 domain-containing protein [Pikeienuella piscinae]